MSALSRRGLGRGLTAIIPEAEQSELDALSPEDRLFQSLVNSGFDLLDAQVAPSIVAYLHVAHDDEPNLSLRRPALGSLTPSRAFSLFHKMALATEGDAMSTFEFEGSRGITVTSSGQASDGLHVVAGGLMDDPDTDTTDIVRACLAFASACHQFHEPIEADELPRLIIEVENGKTTVESHVSLNDALHTGRASSEHAVEAVTRSILDAHEVDDEIVDVREVALTDERAVLVVLRGDAGVAVGLARSSQDSAHTASVAASRALRGRRTLA